MDDDMELGEARARVLRLAREVARLRHTSTDRVCAALRTTRLWREIGSPELRHISAEQAAGAARLLERWRDKALEVPRDAPRRPSAAPAPPWAAGGGGVR